MKFKVRLLTAKVVVKPDGNSKDILCTYKVEMSELGDWTLGWSGPVFSAHLRRAYPYDYDTPPLPVPPPVPTCDAHRRSARSWEIAFWVPLTWVVDFIKATFTPVPFSIYSDHPWSSVGR